MMTKYTGYEENNILIIRDVDYIVILFNFLFNDSTLGIYSITYKILFISNENLTTLK